MERYSVIRTANGISYVLFTDLNAVVAKGIVEKLSVDTGSVYSIALDQCEGFTDSVLLTRMFQIHANTMQTNEEKSLLYYKLFSSFNFSICEPEENPEEFQQQVIAIINAIDVIILQE